MLLVFASLLITRGLPTQVAVCWGLASPLRLPLPLPRRRRRGGGWWVPARVQVPRALVQVLVFAATDRLLGALKQRPPAGAAWLRAL